MPIYGKRKIKALNRFKELKEVFMKSRIVLAREYAKLNQKELAEILGISPSTLNGYERGNHDPKSDGLIKIAKACNVTTDFLLGLSDIVNKETDIQTKAEINKISFEPDKRLQQIIHCYNEMDDVGREFLADQAEYWLEKHPRAKEKEA